MTFSLPGQFRVIINEDFVGIWDNYEESSAMSTSNKLDSAMLADISYYLAFASALLLVPSFLRVFGPLQQIFWLATVTSAIGSVLGIIARGELNRAERPPSEAVRRAKIGFLFNLIIFVVMLVFVVVIVGLLVSGVIVPG